MSASGFANIPGPGYDFRESWETATEGRMSQSSLSRRERRRVDTIVEIKRHAMDQIGNGGVEALSLNAIAKKMAVSGGAIYRYFASRDELLIALVVDAFDSFADALEHAAAGDHRSDSARFLAVADAYREWALDDPNRYRLAWNTRPGSGLLVPDRVVPAAQRSMNVLLAVLAPAGAERGESRQLSGDLETQLQAWHQRWGVDPLPSATLHRGMVAWTRLHGVISLELDGHLSSTGVDPALLYRAETEVLAAGLS